MLQSEAASVHQRSVFNRFPINTFPQYSPYPVIYRIKVRTVRRPQVWREVWVALRVAAAQLFHVHDASISWFSVFDFTKNVKQASDDIPGIQYSQSAVHLYAKRVIVPIRRV